MARKSQLSAVRRYEKRNPEKTRYEQYRRNARSFIRHHASKADFEELKKIIREKEQKMSKNIELNLSTDPIIERMIRKSFSNPEVPFDLNGTVFLNLKAFYDFLTDNLKQDGDFIPYLQDLVEKDSAQGAPDGNGEYELGSWETKSGHAERIGFIRKTDYDKDNDEYTYQYEF